MNTDATSGAPAAAVRFVVSGKVQGVFYRASTAEQARALGLDGWARNLPSGDVEIVARGAALDLARLAAWLWEGPARAVVEGVSAERWRGGDVPRGFTTA
jgi:acylphosphatase